MQQWIRQYSWTPSWTVYMKILLDIRVTVFFQRAIQPSAVLSYWKLEQDKCVWNDYSLYVMSTVSNSVKQCQTVSTVWVSAVSTVSTVIARCYLHLRWYFCTLNCQNWQSKWSRELHRMWPNTFWIPTYSLQISKNITLDTLALHNYWLVKPHWHLITIKVWMKTLIIAPSCAHFWS